MNIRDRAQSIYDRLRGVENSSLKTHRFTIRIREAGFTDQLLQFGTFYKLGLHMGMEYRHQCFGSRRSGTGGEIYEFLGFETAIAQVSKPLSGEGEVATIPVMIGDDILRSRSVGSLPQLVRHVEREVDLHDGEGRPASGKGGARVEDSMHARRPVVEFTLASGQGRRFFGLVHQAIPDFQSPLDLMQGYRASRSHEPWQSRFPEGKTRILLHVRQGDTAVVPIGGGRKVALWGRRAPVYLSSHEDPGPRYLEPASYVEFMNVLFKECDLEGGSLVCSSDGYLRAADLIRQHAELLKLDETELESIRDECVCLDHTLFENIPDASHRCLMIGEGEDNLRNLVDCALQADIIVIGTQQRMLPKLMSMYFSESRTPLFLVLTRNSNRPDYEGKLGLTPRKAEVLFVDLDKPASGWITPTIRAAIDSRMRTRG